MNATVAPSIPEGQRPCEICGFPVWRARFGNGHDWRQVETAAPSRSTVGKILESRNVGHVALTLPLPGTGGEIRGSITKRRTPYRLHACRSFSAARTSAERKADGRGEPGSHWRARSWETPTKGGAK